MTTQFPFESESPKQCWSYSTLTTKCQRNGFSLRIPYYLELITTMFDSTSNKEIHNKDINPISKSEFDGFVRFVQFLLSAKHQRIALLISPPWRKQYPEGAIRVPFSLLILRSDLARILRCKRRPIVSRVNDCVAL